MQRDILWMYLLIFTHNQSFFGELLKANPNFMLSFLNLGVFKLLPDKVFEGDNGHLDGFSSCTETTYSSCIPFGGKSQNYPASTVILNLL